MLDRRPMSVISCSTGMMPRLPHNPAGLVEAWNTPARARDWLFNQLEHAVSLGATRVLIDRPMGSDGRTFVPGSSWLTMQLFQRDAIAEAVQVFTTLEIIPFVGARLRRADDLTGYNPDASAEERAAFTQLLDGEHDGFAQSLLTVGGWFNAGVRTLAIDNAAAEDNQVFFAELAARLRRNGSGLNIMGEAVPTDESLETAMPWIATADFFDRFMPDRRFDPRTTQVYVWFRHNYAALSPAQRVDLVMDQIDLGRIPITADPVMFRVAARHAEWSARVA